MPDDEEDKARDADPPQGVEIARITIVKTFDDDAPGGSAVWTTYSDGLTLLDAMGMIAWALAVVYKDYGTPGDEDDA